MGKLAVVFFAALAIHAVFGEGIVRDYERELATSGLGYGRDELRDLVRQLVTVSDDIFETFQSTPLRRGFSWENREFEREIEDIIVVWEEMVNQHNERTSGHIINVLRQLREIHSIVRELKTVSDDSTMRTLQVALATTIQKVVKSIEIFSEMFEETHLTGAIYTEIKTIWRKLVVALRKLHESVRTYAVPSERNWYGEETTLVRELQMTLERDDYDDHLMKRAFMHLVRKYFETFTPEVQDIHFLTAEVSKYSVHEVKTHIVSFVEKFIGEIERMPETARVTFVKATREFETRVGLMNAVNTPKRQLVIRIQNLADLLTNIYESLPYHTSAYTRVAMEHHKVLIEILHRFISEVEETGRVGGEFVMNLRKLVSRLDGQKDQSTLVVVIQEATVEVRKFLMSGADMTVGVEFLNSLRILATSFKNVYVRDVEIWGYYLMAQTNRMSLYLQNNIHSEDWAVLVRSVNKAIGILANSEYAKVARVLSEIIREFEAKPYMINSLLQKISMELHKFIWVVYEERQSVPNEIYDVVELYIEALEDIHFNQRFIKAVLATKTPVELTLKAQAVADRLTMMVHFIVPGYKQIKVSHRVHYFNQILELVTFRMRKLSGKSTELFSEVYENLNQIQNHLESVLQQPNMPTKVNFGVYIQNAVMQLRKLAFGRRFEGNTEVVKMYSDFVYGLEYVLNQLQFDLQIIVEEYDVKTLNLQVEVFGHGISRMLQRLQPKHELERVVLNQLVHLSNEVEALAKVFEMLGVAELATKYNVIYRELHQVARMGWGKSFEELCRFFDVYVNTIVRDLGVLSTIKNETPEFYDIYKFTLVAFSNIMARFENVQFDEYYQVIVKTNRFPEYVRKLTTKITTKVQNGLVETDGIKHDLTLRGLLFVQRLEGVALRFQVESKIVPEGLYNIISGLHQLLQSPVSVSQLRVELGKAVVAVFAEIEKIVRKESLIGAKVPLIEYMVALEQLYFDVFDVVERSTNEQTFQEIFTRIDMGVHCFTKSLEHINSENKRGLAVLTNEYHRLVNFVTILFRKIEQITGRNGISDSVVGLTAGYNSVDKLEVAIIDILRKVSVVLKELSWLDSDNSEINTIFKNILDEFLTVVHRMHVAIEADVLIGQRMYNLKKWGWGVSSKYDGTFGKYYSKNYEMPNGMVPTYKSGRSWEGFYDRKSPFLNWGRYPSFNQYKTGKTWERDIPTFTQNWDKTTEGIHGRAWEVPTTKNWARNSLWSRGTNVFGDQREFKTETPFFYVLRIFNVAPTTNQAYEY